VRDEKWGIRNSRSKKAFRKELRNFGTPAEAVLWKSLQRRQLLGKKFRRQQSFGRYIVDFYCPECRLVVELDGRNHYSITRDSYEDERTKYLMGLGLRVLRFENRDLLENLDSVLAAIMEVLRTET
jgi:very-short-patch-repair endonuclease